MNPKILKTQTLVRVGVILAILILLNIVSIRIFTRLDMTANNLFTLSDASKELMQSIDDMVTIRAYFTEDLPAPY
ncbi:MAG: Gldg family protein, partial [Bacteroidota bacterium]